MFVTSNKNLGKFKLGFSGFSRVSPEIDPSYVTSQNLVKLREDHENQRAIVQTILHTPQAYTREEDELINEKLELFDYFSERMTHLSRSFNAPRDKKRIRSIKNIQLDSLATKATIFYLRGDLQAVGYATTTVLATPEEIMGSYWNLMSRAKEVPEEIEKKVDELVNDHNQLFYLRLKSKWKLVQDREWLTRFIWKRLDGGSLVRVAVAIKDRPNRGVYTEGIGATRATTEGVVKVTKLNSTTSRVEVVNVNSAGGKVPSFLSALFMKRYLSKSTVVVRRNFQSLRRLAVWDTEDGRIIGDWLVVKNPKKSIEAHVREVFENSAGLQDV